MENQTSNTAETLYTGSSPGVFTIPAGTRAILQSNSASLPQVLSGATPLDVALQRQLGSGNCQFTPSAAWSFYTQYSHEAENGYRPFGTLLSGNVLELPEPVDYRTHELKAGVEYGGNKGGFQAGYAASILHNQASSLVWDSPFTSTDATGAASHGQMTLYPNNNAQSLNFAGAINLFGSTRLMISISPGWMRQNAPFLPFTTN